MSTSEEGVSCQRQDSLFNVEKLSDIDQLDQDSLNEHIIAVELLRNADGFGFTIKGGTDQALYEKDHGIFITDIKKGSSADKTKHLEVGDKILEVNGHSLSGLKHGEVVNHFKNSNGRVNLIVHKNIGLLLEAASYSEESSPMDSPREDGKELEGFSPIGFIAGIAIGCLAVFALRRYLMQR